ncbi:MULTISPECIES: hypothetical protein [Haloferacaceae]|uniref:Uncharacterized protein n=1 Tax=Halorubrum glutamatedens TaxID=2707018 RepID=A0ABD5QN98_9EURY|nr:hypothetical protein [Halobellus captivus]
MTPELHRRPRQNPAGTPNHDNYNTTLTTFTDYDVYRFEQNSGTPGKIAVKAIDLAT